MTYLHSNTEREKNPALKGHTADTEEEKNGVVIQFSLSPTVTQR